MHDGGIGTDWPPEDIVGVGEVNDDDLILLIDLFAHTDKMVGLKGQGLCDGLPCEQMKQMGTRRGRMNLERN
jgi:hypothetical protein